MGLGPNKSLHSKLKARWREIEKEQGICSNVEIGTSVEQFPNEPYQSADDD